MKKSLIICTLFLAGCASITPPDGGARDELPPRVLWSYPDSAQTMVSPEYFSFTFDEYVKTKQIQDLLIISPTLSSKPRTEIKKKTLFIRFDDTLKSNTTYSISLSGCIVDNNEGNVLNSHHLAFSTGAVLDSLNYSAFVSEAFSKQACAECLLVLYDQDRDSGALLYRPTYLAQTNAAGYATISNLAEGDYWVQALKDENKNLLLNNDEMTSLRRKIHLHDSMVTDSFQVFPYAGDTKNSLSFKMIYPGVGQLVFDRPMVNESFSLLLNGQEHKTAFNQSLDTALFYFKAAEGDSIHIHCGWDSTVYDFKEEVGSFKPGFRAKYNLKKNELSISGLQKLSAFELARFQLIEDSIPIKIKDAKLSANKLTLYLSRAPAKNLTLILKDSAVLNINQQFSLKDSVQLTAYNPESSLLVLDLQLQDSAQYIVQLLKRDKVLDQKIVESSQKIEYKDLGVGTYSFRIIKDLNRNKLWDSGDYLNGIPAEPLKLSQGTDLRPNWDKELIIKY